jgi:hypothetical protein
LKRYYDAFITKGVSPFAMAYQDPEQAKARAWDRIGKTRVVQARWILSLKKRGSFDALTRADEESLVQEIWGYLNIPAAEPGARRYAAAWYQRIQNGFKSLLVNKFLRRRQWTVRIGHYRTAVIGYRERTLTILSPRTKYSDRLADDVLKALMTLNGILRKCLACGELFIRVRRQQFCSTKCASHTRLRRFRRKNEPKS